MPHLGQHRSGALALAMALLLLTAPLRVALRRGCDFCPPDCPMHAAAHAADPAKGGAPVMRCHGAERARHANEASHGPRLTRPPCGSRAAVVGIDLTSMLPSAALPWRDAPRVARAPDHPRTATSRGAQPPDTPPPLARA